MLLAHKVYTNDRKAEACSICATEQPDNVQVHSHFGSVELKRFTYCFVRDNFLLLTIRPEGTTLCSYRENFDDESRLKVKFGMRVRVSVPLFEVS